MKIAFWCLVLIAAICTGLFIAQIFVGSVFDYNLLINGITMVGSWIFVLIGYDSVYN